MSITTMITIEKVSCGVCGVYFGLETSQLSKYRRDGSWFYCPNGDHIHYLETENERLTKELEAERRRLRSARATLTSTRDQLESEKRSKAAVKGHLTRVQRRISNGVCPCCQRSFANVAQHMDNKHPEFVEELNQKKEFVK